MWRPDPGQVKFGPGSAAIPGETPSFSDPHRGDVIDGFEMERRIPPALTGLRAPKCIASSDFSHRPTIAAGWIAGDTRLGRIDDAPPPASEGAISASPAPFADPHRQNVIHLDLKPSNVMRRPGRIRDLASEAYSDPIPSYRKRLQIRSVFRRRD